MSTLMRLTARTEARAMVAMMTRTVTGRRMADWTIFMRYSGVTVTVAKEPLTSLPSVLGKSISTRMVREVLSSAPEVRVTLAGISVLPTLIFTGELSWILEASDSGTYATTRI